MTITPQAAGSVFGTAEQRVSSRDGVESRLELAHVVALDQTGHERSPLFGNARVACTTPTPALLD
jgi:hypothetical protein